MFNQITLIGNLGNDPELRYTASGVPVAAFRLAVNEKFTVDGEKRKKTIWVRVTLWRTDAENAAKYLVKGNQVLVVGALEEPNAYVNKAGEPAASIEVTGRTIKYLSKPSEGKCDEAQTAKGVQKAVEKRLAMSDEDIPF